MERSDTVGVERKDRKREAAAWTAIIAGAVFGDREDVSGRGWPQGVAEGARP